MLNWLIDVSLRNRFVVLLLAAAFATLGAYALTRLDIDAFPETTPVQVQINVTAPALSPDEVETQITAPLEQALGGLPKLHAVRSVSKFGLAQVVVLFEDDTDIYFARQVVNERLTSVELPAGIARPKLGPVSTGLGEVFHYVVSLKGRDLSKVTDAERIEKLTYLRTIHDWTIKPKLRTVPGVAEVNSWGGCEKQYQVRPDPDRLLKYNLTFNDVIDALDRNNRNVGGGGVKQNNQFLLVQGLGRTSSVNEIRNIVLTARDGVPIKVRDVADVEIGHEVRRGSMTAMGKGEAVLGLCFLTMGENSKTVSTALRAKLDEIRPSLPADVDVEIVYDRTELVDIVIETVRKNLFEGGLLVIAVLFAFLGNLRAAAIVAVIIPLSMLFAFTGMWKFGIAASLLSLGALDFGMVVDSSVVMVENCVRQLAHGDNTRTKVEVIRDAAVEVRKPTLFGELIIMIVYLPILTLEGTEGKLFRPMALTVIFALLGSMILSMTLMPVLASLVLPRKIRETEPLLMRVAHRLYRPVLRFSMAFKLPVLVFALSLCGIAFGMILPHLGSEFIPKLSEGAIAMNVVRLAGTDLAESNHVNGVMERLILANFPDEVRHVWSRVGSAEVATDPMGIELTDMYITLKPREQWTKAKTQDELTDQIREVLQRIPGQKIAFEQPIEMRMSEMETGIRTDLGIRLFGDDYTVLTKEAAKIETALKAIRGSEDVSVEQVTGQPVLQIKVLQDEIARYGIPARSVLDVIQAVGTLPAGEIVEGALRFPLALRLPEQWRSNPEAIGAILVAAPSGERVPLARLTSIQRINGPSVITRESGQRRIVISCNVRNRDIGSFVAEAKAAIKPIEDQLPKGRYFAEFGGQYESYERARLRLFIVIPVALLMIFTLLYFTYHNVIDALRVLTGVPFGCVGGLFALWLRDMPMSISALVGFIALSGVAVLDDMILVSTVRQFRNRGMSVTDAVRQASLVRLRPVLMTTLVAALGFLPMALSTGQGAEVQRPLATVVIGGVIGAMLMSLLVLRVLYLIFDKMARGLYAICVRVLRMNPTTAATLLGLSEVSQLQEE
ncbi:CusA/CzcA family heavy metal efflux RND transporter [soil metagenome]